MHAYKLLTLKDGCKVLSQKLKTGMLLLHSIRYMYMYINYIDVYYGVTRDGAVIYTVVLCAPAILVSTHTHALE